MEPAEFVAKLDELAEQQKEAGGWLLAQAKPVVKLSDAPSAVRDFLGSPFGRAFASQFKITFADESPGPSPRSASRDQPSGGGPGMPDLSAPPVAGRRDSGSTGSGGTVSPAVPAPETPTAGPRSSSSSDEAPGPSIQHRPPGPSAGQQQ